MNLWRMYHVCSGHPAPCWAAATIEEISYLCGVEIEGCAVSVVALASWRGQQKNFGPKAPTLSCAERDQLIEVANKVSAIDSRARC